MKQKNPIGKIVGISGVVVDAYFSDHLPEKYSALKVNFPNNINVVLEVQNHIGNNVVRAIAMATTDNMYCGQAVEDTCLPIQTPVGKEVLGRVLNVTGDPIDEKEPIEA